MKHWLRKWGFLNLPLTCIIAVKELATLSSIPLEKI
jgi:hypothetical protein